MLRSKIRVYWDKVAEEFVHVNLCVYPSPRGISNANALGQYSIDYVRRLGLTQILQTQTSKEVLLTILHDECLVKSCQHKIRKKAGKVRHRKSPKYGFASTMGK